MLKDQLLLIVRFKNDRVFVESFDPPNQFHTADQENGDRGLITAHGIEVNVLNVLGRRFVFHRNSLKIYELFQELVNLVLNFLAISRPIKPSNLGLLAEPSHLTFGITSCVTLDYTNRRFPWDRGIEIGDNVPIPNRLKWLRALRNITCEQFPDFLYETSLEHAANALVDPFVEFLSGRIQAHEVNCEARYRLARPFIQMLRQRFSCFQTNL